MIINNLKQLLGCISLLLPVTAFAADTLDPAATVWLMVSIVIVLLMFIPGLALFYGGMVRSKNILSLFTQFFAVAGVVGILWVALVYSLATDTSGMQAGIYNWHSIVGGLDKAMLSNITAETLSGTIPEYIVIVFLMTFAMITPCIALGGFAERMKFEAAVIFSALWIVIVYGPMAHMVWGGDGALFHNWGVLDFAGGTAVHIAAGVTAFVGAMVLGKRKGWPTTPMPPHNMVFVMIGAALLWAGWFGFNVGSALAINSSAALIMMTTMLATCGGIIGWMFAEKQYRGHVTSFGLASGAIGGLVGITPAAAYVGPFGAIMIGILASIASFYAIMTLKRKFGVDDALDVFSLHGIGGIVGCLLTGIFCIPELGGNIEGIALIPQFFAQLASIVMTFAYVGILSWILLKLIDKTIGLRVTTEQEQQGLDVSEHNESAYNH
ncbi:MULTISPECIES: ammonium transporter [unclassified Acinetobacter]|uniref:ammonium transporter n=1 Tax=unclassified Acinetobacter TaxID=196816 RepID=UPI00293483C6|nr:MULTISPECIES: ammonium transporter [unclassified Acinetobacter]WOE32445.1 ammonium transporter [Acinetobacter sp. SAAs470]WOE37920.1 ammonium transporter [Acinetobacter sp. SAAs474]